MAVGKGGGGGVEIRLIRCACLYRPDQCMLVWLGLFSYLVGRIYRVSSVKRMGLLTPLSKRDTNK